MIDKIWEKLNRLSEDAEKAAIAKAKELGFDLNKGEITLDESFINLNADVASLRDAIEKEKLIQLPLSIQREIDKELEAISNSLTGLAAGNDEIINLVEGIEVLHTEIWRIGLQRLSKEYLGYQTKLNQVKQLEVQVQGLRRELEDGVALKTAFEDLINAAKQNQAALETELANATKSAESAAEHLDNISEVDQKAGALLTKIEQNQVTATEQSSKATASSAEVVAIEAKIKEFYEKVDAYRSDIAETKTKAATAVEANDKKTKDLIKELGTLEGQIREQIQRATGHSLFHSFQTRQEMLAKGKWAWIGALLVLVTISVLYSVLLAYSFVTFDTVFYLKLTFTIPMVFAIVFCTVQYSRERRLEEEYAFKSSISISLVPYQELVEKLVDKKQAPEREKFAAFLIDAVTNVFSSPTDKIWETTEKDSSGMDRSVKRFTRLIRPIIKGLRHG